MIRRRQWQQHRVRRRGCKPGGANSKLDSKTTIKLAAFMVAERDLIICRRYKTA